LLPISDQERAHLAAVLEEVGLLDPKADRKAHPALV
jgi:hypothetical protein